MLNEKSSENQFKVMHSGRSHLLLRIMTSFFSKTSDKNKTPLPIDESNYERVRVVQDGFEDGYHERFHFSHPSISDSESDITTDDEEFFDADDKQRNRNQRLRIVSDVDDDTDNDFTVAPYCNDNDGNEDEVFRDNNGELSASFEEHFGVRSNSSVNAKYKLSTQNRDDSGSKHKLRVVSIEVENSVVCPVDVDDDFELYGKYEKDQPCNNENPKGHFRIVACDYL